MLPDLDILEDWTTIRKVRNISCCSQVLFVARFGVKPNNQWTKNLRSCAKASSHNHPGPVPLLANQAVATLGPHRGKSDSESSAFPFRADRNRSILNC